MRKVYNKLVRDRIPEIIREEGRACEAVVISPDEYRKALLEKLVEEVQEAMGAEPGGMISELADLLEVIDAIAALHNIDPDSIRAEQVKKRSERGGFTRRLLLLWTDDN